MEQMYENSIYGIMIIVLLGFIYYIYKWLKKKIMINRDYNRKINKEDLKTRKDLAVLREELFKTDNPNVRNEILNKIEAIVKSNEREEDE
jgi:hypothetical protein